MKTHRKADGTYAMCRAGKRACPRGGEEVHKDFASKQELAAYNEGLLQEEHGLVATSRKERTSASPRRKSPQGAPPQGRRRPLPAATYAFPQEVERELEVLEGLQGSSERLSFMKMAVEDAQVQDTVDLFEARDPRGNLLALASLEHREEENDGEGWSMPKHAVIQHMGSLGQGGGKALTRLLREEAHRRGEELYLEATSSSYSYWEAQGAVMDPYDRGVEFYGWRPSS